MININIVVCMYTYIYYKRINIGYGVCNILQRFQWVGFLKCYYNDINSNNNRSSRGSHRAR